MSSQQRSMIVAPQSSIGTVTTALTNAFVIPTDTVNYADASVNRMARDGTGSYTPRVKRQKATKSYTITGSGDLYYEMLPWLFTGTFRDVASPSSATPFNYVSAYSPEGGDGAFGIQYYTAWIWSVEEVVRIGSCFFDTWTLSGNAQSGTLRYDFTMFGGEFTDSPSPTVATPSTYQIEGKTNSADSSTAALGLCHPLDISLFADDATGATGSTSVTTELECNLLDWSITVQSPWRPLFAANGGTDGVYCTAVRRMPAITMNFVLRTEAATIAAARTRYLNDTPVAIKFKIGPDGSSRLFDFTVAGHWSNVPSVHDDSEEIVVMNAEFTAESPVNQITSPLWMEAEMDTTWDMPI